MSRPDITIRAGDLWAEVWRHGTHLQAQATVLAVSDATAREIPGDGNPLGPFSVLNLACPDGTRVTVHLPPDVATRMAAAFHAPDRLPAVTAAMDEADRQSVSRGGMTEVPTRALMEIRRALAPAQWADATAGRAAE